MVGIDVDAHGAERLLGQEVWLDGLGGRRAPFPNGVTMSPGQDDRNGAVW